LGLAQFFFVGASCTAATQMARGGEHFVRDGEVNAPETPDA